MKVINNLIFRKFLNLTGLSPAGMFFLMAGISVLAVVLSGCRKDEETGENERIESEIKSILDDINTDSLRSYVDWLEAKGTRFALAENRRSVAVSIKEKFIGSGYPDARLDSFFITRTYRNVTYRQWQYNVIAIIRGEEYPDSACILGSHYDSITGSAGDPFTAAPGGHDNASGTAATLEVARVLRKNNFTPDRSIIFIAFGAEELGLFGSHDFAADPGEFKGRISFMLNNDMIGYDTGTDPDLWVVNILDYPNSTGLRTGAEKLIQKYTLLGSVNDNQYNRQSDSYPFYLRGYKALFFSSAESDPYYHTVNDTGSNLNYEYLREVTKISCAMLLEMNY